MYIFFFVTTASLFGQEKDYVTTSKTLKLMGTRFDITVVAANKDVGQINIDEATAEIRRIEALISSWNPDSETTLINKNAGMRPVKVSAEIFQLIQRAKQISELTDGAFDITFSPKDGIWKFDGSMKRKPTDQEIEASIAKVGYQKIMLNEKDQTVFLKHKGMEISFGAIGKGYAADRAKELLISKQVVGGIINAAGDLTTWGTKPNGDKWLIGVADPFGKEKILSWLPIVESSVATSGSSEKFVVFDNIKYSHIIDPRTGNPVTDVISVSILAKSAEFCDALATAVFIMGKEAGLSLVNQLGGIEIILVDSKNKVHKSSGILLESAPKS